MQIEYLQTHQLKKEYLENSSEEKLKKLRVGVFKRSISVCNSAVICKNEIYMLSSFNIVYKFNILLDVLNVLL